MTSPEPYGTRRVLNCIVDEAGDPSLFTSKGKELVGKPGCSTYFILGELEVADPPALGRDLEHLREKLLSDAYFRHVPSMRPDRGKTALAFHATDDIPEVRSEVFHVLSRHDLRFYAVVGDKRDLLAVELRNREQDPKHRYQPNALYDDMVAYLFSGLHHDDLDSHVFYNFHGEADEVNVCFAWRGNSDRTEAMRHALDRASRSFKQEFGSPLPQAQVRVGHPPGNAGLQATDYFLWALQRLYERNEERYLSFIWPQVVEIHKIYALGLGNLSIPYTKDHPLTLAAKLREEEHS
jgi:hypothetical protein